MCKEGLVLRAMQRLGIANPHTTTTATTSTHATTVNTNTAVASATTVTADQWAAVLRQVMLTPTNLFQLYLNIKLPLLYPILPYPCIRSPTAFVVCG